MKKNVLNLTANGEALNFCFKNILAFRKSLK